MNEENPISYYAVIPATVRYDGRLKANEKLLYGEITALSNKNGYCYAQNRYFANLYKVNNETVSRWLSNLQKYGYIAIEIQRTEKKRNSCKKYLYCRYPLLSKKSIPLLRKKSRGYWRKSQR